MFAEVVLPLEDHGFKNLNSSPEECMLEPTEHDIIIDIENH